jgi:RHS repeat-associated protein
MTNTGGVTNTLYFLHTDHLGSNSITTNASGAVLARQSYMPYGSIRSGGVGVMPTDIGYTGQRLDAGTGGLMYYRARYYLPGLGRFASADTVVPSPRDPQAFNRYLYAGGNPLKYVDPSGHDWIDTLGQFASGVLFQWSVSNREAVIPSSPDQRQAVEALAADTDAFVAGRIVGGVLAAGQGVLEFSSGAGAMGGGLAACGSGVLCPAGVGAVAGGAVVAAHGASVVIQGAAAAGQQLARLISGTGSSSSPKGFADSTTLAEHFKKHGAEFGFTSESEYLAGAQKFVASEGTEGVLSKVRANGDIVLYNSSTNEFAVVSRDEIIRTYFKPDPSIHGYETNLDYFNAQVR